MTEQRETTLQRTVAQMNIERFELMLITEKNEATRQTLVRLLRKEKEQLALLDRRSAPDSPSSRLDHDPREFLRRPPPTGCPTASRTSPHEISPRAGINDIAAADAPALDGMTRIAAIARGVDLVAEVNAHFEGGGVK